MWMVLSVWAGNVYGNRGWGLDVWEDVSGDGNPVQNTDGQK